jgi:hypothetical protein
MSKWVNIPFLEADRRTLSNLKNKLSDSTFKKDFLIRDSYFYNKVGFTFLNRNGERTRYFQARTIDKKSLIVKELLSGKNLIANYINDPDTNVFEARPEGIVVTQQFLNKLGFKDQKVSYLYLDITDDYYYLPVPIIAVVKELPELASVVCSKSFLCNRYHNQTWRQRDTVYLSFLVQNITKSQARSLRKNIADKLEIEDVLNIMMDTIVSVTDSTFNYFFDIGYEGINLPKKEKLKRVAAIPGLENIIYGEYFKLVADPDCDDEELSHDYLALEFEKLDKIMDFARYIEESTKVSMNMETRKQRENYLFIGNLALAALLMVIVFSVFSLSLYISETFKNHILKVKKNLGNLMALGASNNELIILYLQVALRMLIYAILSAFVLAYISGELFEKYILGKLLVLQQDQDYFSLLNSWVLIFIAILIVIALFMTLLTIKRILKASPGDLIYERDKNRNIKICSGKKKSSR